MAGAHSQGVPAEDQPARSGFHVSRKMAIRNVNTSWWGSKPSAWCRGGLRSRTQGERGLQHDRFSLGSQRYGNVDRIGNAGIQMAAARQSLLLGSRYLPNGTPQVAPDIGFTVEQFLASR
jgi:hypothetical protein